MENNIFIGNNLITPATYRQEVEATDSMLNESTETFAQELDAAMNTQQSALPQQTFPEQATLSNPEPYRGNTVTNDLLVSMMLGGGTSGITSLMAGVLFQKLLDSTAQNNVQGAYTQCVHQQHNHGNSAVVELAMSRLGDPYSQGMAGQDKYTDCSYLAKWCYSQLGINLPRTAAEQAQYCEENGMAVSRENLQPGDLVFFSHGSNGRYKNITHVGIYAGNNMIVDASSSNGQVVYREMLGGQVSYGRPGIYYGI